MLASNRISNEIDSMKKDATKVIENLSTLSTHLTEVTKNEVGDFASEAYNKISHEVAGYRDTLNSIKINVQRRLKDVDKSVKTNPYPFLVGSVGIGYIMGKLLRHRSSSKSL